MEPRPRLSLNEWAVLGVLVDQPSHGYDIATELRASSPIGSAWRVTRPLVYRALERLEAAGHIEPRRTEPGSGGPPRTIYGPTRRGRAALRSWLSTPVEHLRDVRTSLLLKLVLLERLNLDRTELVRAQRVQFDPRLRTQAKRPADDDVIGLWRHHSAASIDEFLRLLG